MPEILVAAIEPEIASSNEETKEIIAPKGKQKAIHTRITALVAAPTGVADRWGRGTWRDIFVESSRRGIFRGGAYKKL